MDTNKCNMQIFIIEIKYLLSKVKRVTEGKSFMAVCMYHAALPQTFLQTFKKS